jgi:hypothetical protein
VRLRWWAVLGVLSYPVWLVVAATAGLENLQEVFLGAAAFPAIWLLVVFIVWAARDTKSGDLDRPL